MYITKSILERILKVSSACPRAVPRTARVGPSLEAFVTRRLIGRAYARPSNDDHLSRVRPIPFLYTYIYSFVATARALSVRKSGSPHLLPPFSRDRVCVQDDDDAEKRSKNKDCHS